MTTTPTPPEDRLDQTEQSSAPTSPNISQLSKIAWDLEHRPDPNGDWAEWQAGKRFEALREELGVDLDDDQLEIFFQYLEQLRAIGVDAFNSRVVEALNGNPQNIESAALAVLDYAESLQQKNQDFQSQHHATNCLVRALQDGW